jgi:hypothetical protein
VRSATTSPLCALVVAAAALVGTAGPAAADTLPLPTPATAQDVALLNEVGARADRVLVSVVPGPVRNDEVVLAGLDGTGTPQRVLLEQRLLLTGKGDYQVRERGPARASEALGDEPAPVTKFGAVVWQGFSPGERELAARLTLDPVLEAPRLPLAVAVSFTGADGVPATLGAGGQVPGAGTVSLRLTNQTAQPATLPTAADVDAAAVAAALDVALAAARAPAGPRLPTADDELPAELDVDGPAQLAGTAAVPVRVTGTVTVTGAAATVTGPATTPADDGARVAGTLPGGASVAFTVTTDGPGTLQLDLSAVPALDPRALTPPGGAPDWAAWARSGPDQAARQAALDLLVRAAATGARATSYAPYLGADLPGTGTTVFRYAFAPVEAVAAVRAPLEPKPGALALAGVALALVMGNTALLWRES